MWLAADSTNPAADSELMSLLDCLPPTVMEVVVKTLSSPVAGAAKQRGKVMRGMLALWVCSDLALSLLPFRESLQIASVHCAFRAGI